MENIPLSEWKAKYGRIFSVWLDNQEIYFRLLSIQEIEICKKNSKLISNVIDSIVLNKKSLSTGAKFKLSGFLIDNSFPSTDDELQEKVLHHRYRVKDDFSFFLISKICSVFVSYTPDQLKEKSLDQLLELIAIAEITIGKQLLGKQKKGITPRNIQERTDGKFLKPDVAEMMDESQNALQEAMLKAGKKIPTFDQVKNNKPKNGLTQQMQELNNIAS